MLKITFNRFLIFLFLFGMIIFPNGSIILRAIKFIIIIFGIIKILQFARVRIEAYTKWSFFLTILAFLSIIWALSPTQAKAGATTILLNFLCIFSILQLLTVEDDWKKTVYPCLIWLPVVRFITLIFTYGTGVFLGLRTVQYENYNSVGLFAAFGFVIAYYLGKNNTSNNKWSYYLSMILNFIVVALTMSRKSILYIIIPLVFFYIFNSKNMLKSIRNVLVVTLTIALIYYLVMHVDVLYQYIGSGFESLFSFFKYRTGDESAAGRVARINVGYRWFMDSPIYGNGAMNYYYLFSRIDNTGLWVADNNFIEILVSYGLVGFILYYFQYLRTFATSFYHFKSLTKEQIVWLGILIAQLVCDYGSSSYIYLHIQFYIFIAMLILLESKGKTIALKSQKK